VRKLHIVLKQKL